MPAATQQDQVEIRCFLSLHRCMLVCMCRRKPCTCMVHACIYVCVHLYVYIYIHTVARGRNRESISVTLCLLLLRWLSLKLELARLPGCGAQWSRSLHPGAFYACAGGLNSGLRGRYFTHASVHLPSTYYLNVLLLLSLLLPF